MEPVRFIASRHQRRAAGLASLHGTSLLLVKKTLEHGFKALAFSADVTCAAINHAIATPLRSP